MFVVGKPEKIIRGNMIIFAQPDQMTYGKLIGAALIACVHGL